MKTRDPEKRKRERIKAEKLVEIAELKAKVGKLDREEPINVYTDIPEISITAVRSERRYQLMNVVASAPPTHCRTTPTDATPSDRLALREIPVREPDATPRPPSEASLATYVVYSDMVAACVCIVPNRKPGTSRPKAS